jgi:hypothetical protein
MRRMSVSTLSTISRLIHGEETLLKHHTVLHTLLFSVISGFARKPLVRTLPADHSFTLAYRKEYYTIGYIFYSHVHIPLSKTTPAMPFLCQSGAHSMDSLTLCGRNVALLR